VSQVLTGRQRVVEAREERLHHVGGRREVAAGGQEDQRGHTIGEVRGDHPGQPVAEGMADEVEGGHSLLVEVADHPASGIVQIRSLGDRPRRIQGVGVVPPGLEANYQVSEVGGRPPE
jgi:hypothetical protein